MSQYKSIIISKDSRILIFSATTLKSSLKKCEEKLLIMVNRIRRVRHFSFAQHIFHAKTYIIFLNMPTISRKVYPF